MRALSNPVGRATLLIGGTQHHFCRIFLQLAQHLTQIGGAGLHAGFGFEFGHLFESQPVIQIGKTPVLGENGDPFEGGCLLFPTCDCGTPL